MSRVSAGRVRYLVRRAVELGPTETAHAASRKVRRAVEPAVRQAQASLARRSVRLGRPGTYAQATFFAVLDGHTLNLQARLPRGAGAPTAADVVFTASGSRRRAPATVHTESDGHTYVEATVLLGDLPGGTPLQPGSWVVTLDLVDAGGGPRRLALRGAATVRSTGPTTSAPPCPITGALFRAGTSPRGNCQITVSAARPSAEVVRIHMRPTAVEIHGRLVGVATGAPAAAELHRRHTDERHLVDAFVEAQRFRFHVPLRLLTPAAPDEQVWDIWLHVPPDRRLRVGRFLHDLHHPAQVFRARRSPVTTEDGTVYNIRPYYTPAGSLALACHRPDATSGVDQ